MRFRYQDPEKIPKWKKYGRLTVIFVAWNIIGYFMLKRLLTSKEDPDKRKVTFSDLNERYKNAMLQSSLMFSRKDSEIRHIKIKGLTVVKDSKDEEVKKSSENMEEWSE